MDNLEYELRTKIATYNRLGKDLAFQFSELPQYALAGPGLLALMHEFLNLHGVIENLCEVYNQQGLKLNEEK